MAQQFLHATQVGAAIEHVGGEAVPERLLDAIHPPLDLLNPFLTPELLTCLTLEVTALGAAAHTSECGNVEIPLLELPLADGNIRQLFLHLNSEPAVQEIPCFTGSVGSMSGVLAAQTSILVQFIRNRLDLSNIEGTALAA